MNAPKKHIELPAVNENDEYRATIQLKYLRDAGWSVGVHNDYYHGGVFFTFWLFTHRNSGNFLKGEGRSDAEAIGKVYDVVKNKPPGAHGKPLDNWHKNSFYPHPSPYDAGVGPLNKDKR